MKKQLLSVLVALFLFSGCYHAQVTTGIQPSSQVYEKKWAHGFIYGLVPPDLLKAEEECDHGVAMIETKRSFLNYVASGLSGGIYTPMNITITCANSERDESRDR